LEQSLEEQQKVKMKMNTKGGSLQNGGYTVFGQVLSQTSYLVSIKFQVMASLPALNIDGT